MNFISVKISVNSSFFADKIRKYLFRGERPVDFEKAMQIYREANISTLPMIEVVILLLHGILKEIALAEEAVAEKDVQFRNEKLLKIQDLLFELMAMIDHKTEEGTRLFAVYVHLNQLLIEVRLRDANENLAEVKRHTEQLIKDWETGLIVSRLQKYTTNQI